MHICSPFICRISFFWPHCLSSSIVIYLVSLRYIILKVNFFILVVYLTFPSVPRCFVVTVPLPLTPLGAEEKYTFGLSRRFCIFLANFDVAKKRKPDRVDIGPTLFVDSSQLQIQSRNLSTSSLVILGISDVA